MSGQEEKSSRNCIRKNIRFSKKWLLVGFLSFPVPSLPPTSAGQQHCILVQKDNIEWKTNVEVEERKRNELNLLFLWPEQEMEEKEGKSSQIEITIPSPLEMELVSGEIEFIFQKPKIFLNRKCKR